LGGAKYLQLGLDGSQWQIQKEVILNTPARPNSFSNFEDDVVIGLDNHGFLVCDLNTELCEHYVPNTPAYNQFQAITVLGNHSVAALRNDPLGMAERWGGVAIWNDGVFSHVLPEEYCASFPLIAGPHNHFEGDLIQYHPGSKPPWSIVETVRGTLMFTNSGITPSTPGYRGGVIEVDPQSLETTVYDTTAGILDGLFGVYYEGWTNSYLTVHQITRDPLDNIWVVNPYSEQYNHTAAVQTASAAEWVHVTADDYFYYLPQEVAFDGNGRAWFGYRRALNYDQDELFSAGGVRVLDYHDNIRNVAQHQWHDVNVDLPGSNVWSLTIDQQGMLWVLTDGGVQGYIVYPSGDLFQSSPIYPQDFFGYIPFRQGDHIRVDSQNNKWIVTRHSGVRVIKENTGFWPTEEGFTSENSPLLSNIVNDIAFDDSAGVAYLATDLGISILKLPFQSQKAESVTELAFSPNPFYIPRDNWLIIDDLPAGAEVSIMTLSGRVLVNLQAWNSGLAATQLLWDGRDSQGEWVNSGIYLVAGVSGKEKRVGKLAVIRQ